MVAALRTIASQNFLTSSSGSFLQICSGFLFRVSQRHRYWHVLVFKTRRLFADVCSRPATPRNRTRWRVERFSFSFSDKLAFHGNRAPNTRPVQTQLQEWPFFFSAFLHTTLLLSIFVFLSLSPPRVACSRVGWFSRALVFRLLYYPWGKMGDYS